jgi:hypothetical protein
VRAQVSTGASGAASTASVVLPAGFYAFRATVSNALRVSINVPAGNASVSAPARTAASPECDILAAVQLRLVAAEAQGDNATVRSLVGALAVALNDAAAISAGDALVDCIGSLAKRHASGDAAGLSAVTSSRLALRVALRERLLDTLEAHCTELSFPLSADGAMAVVGSRCAALRQMEGAHLLAVAAAGGRRACCRR